MGKKITSQMTQRSVDGVPRSCWLYDWTFGFRTCYFLSCLRPSTNPLILRTEMPIRIPLKELFSAGKTAFGAWNTIPGIGIVRTISSTPGISVSSFRKMILSNTPFLSSVYPSVGMRWRRTRSNQCVYYTYVLCVISLCVCTYIILLFPLFIHLKHDLLLPTP